MSICRRTGRNVQRLFDFGWGCVRVQAIGCERRCPFSKRRVRVSRECARMYSQAYRFGEPWYWLAHRSSSAWGRRPPAAPLRSPRERRHGSRARAARGHIGISDRFLPLRRCCHVQLCRARGAPQLGGAPCRRGRALAFAILCVLCSWPPCEMRPPGPRCSAPHMAVYGKPARCLPERRGLGLGGFCWRSTWGGRPGVVAWGRREDLSARGFVRSFAPERALGARVRANLGIVLALSWHRSGLALLLALSP